MPETKRTPYTGTSVMIWSDELLRLEDAAEDLGHFAEQGWDHPEYVWRRNLLRDALDPRAFTYLMGMVLLGIEWKRDAERLGLS